MSKIQPTILANVENTFRAHLKNNKQVAIKLAKENGMLKFAKFSNVGPGKEDLYSSYSLGKHTLKNNPIRDRVINEISQICDKAVEGAKLFADIMGWLK